MTTTNWLRNRTPLTHPLLIQLKLKPAAQGLARDADIDVRGGRLTQSQEGVLGVHEHEHPAQQVLGHDVVLYVVGVVLHAERQQLQD